MRTSVFGCEISREALAEIEHCCREDWLGFDSGCQADIVCDQDDTCSVESSCCCC